jgi:hypothetical protein
MRAPVGSLAARIMLCLVPIGIQAAKAPLAGFRRRRCRAGHWHGPNPDELELERTFKYQSLEAKLHSMPEL